MLELVSLQVIDNFLLNYNVGQVLLLVFVLSVLATLPLGSMRLVAIVTAVFGLIFVITPISLAPVHYKYLGVALLVIGPMLFVTARK